MEPPASQTTLLVVGYLDIGLPVKVLPLARQQCRLATQHLRERMSGTSLS